MLLRLIPHRGGDGTTYGIIAMNDTGSDILSLFDTDMPHLGNVQGYGGFIGNVAIRFANGAINIYPKVLVEVQLVKNDGSPWSNWIEEEAIVQPLHPGLTRLSGLGIRRALFIGTAPGNHFLAVAATKGGLNSLF
jgi:hypothetical protein